MKKFLLLLICCFSLLGLTSCGKNAVVGEWKLAEMTVEVGGMTTTIKAGESFMGMSISEDYMVLEFSKDGTGKIKSAAAGEMEEEFTWEYKDKKYYLSSTDEEDDEVLEVVIEDDYLIMTQEGTTIKFKKSE